MNRHISESREKIGGFGGGFSGELVEYLVEGFGGY